MLLMYTSYSGRYYTECFGMKLLRKRDVPDEKYTNAFLGFGPEDTNFALELTYSMFTNATCHFFLWHKNYFNILLHICMYIDLIIKKLLMDMLLSSYKLINSCPGKTLSFSSTS